ncbi:T9SS type A sorting domain-containing protein [Candidatus Poribacteria bacterium]|nr:T9SS type A sorting domain-containing protein [Candidatus Poribacteria bacterium]
MATGSKDGTILLWELNPSTLSDATEPLSDATESTRRREDVNGDNIVNIQDLVWVASNLGQSGSNPADVNRDGVVNIQDLVLVAGALGSSDSAPAVKPQVLETFTAADVEKWLQETRQLSLTDPVFQRGILILEQLLATLTPKQTALLPNYPNPFNPETWIPYQLAKPTNVKISIYAADGKFVRRLALGTQGAGIYESRSRAAYWDGRNTVGEPVTSGLYFYTFTAGDFSTTRRMVILK